MNKIFVIEFVGYDIPGYDITGFATVIIATNKEHAAELIIEKLMLTYENINHSYFKEQILKNIFEIDINKCGVNILFDGNE